MLRHPEPDPFLAVALLVRDLRLQPLDFHSVAMEDSDSKLGELKAQGKALKKQEAELKAQLRKAKQLQEREGQVWKLSNFMVHVVLIAYALCDYQTPAASKYLVVTGRKRRWPEKTEAELHELVESIFLECDEPELWDLADTSNPTDPTAFAVALRYSEEWKMATYVADQNANLGLAPSTGSLLDRWRQRRTMYPEATRPPDPGPVVENKGRCWARRWRRKWALKYGAIRVRDEIPVGEARGKAGEQNGPKKRDQNELVFRAHFGLA